MADLPRNQEEAEALATIIAREVTAAYVAYENRPEDHMFYVRSDTLKGLPVTELDAMKFEQLWVKLLRETGIAAYPAITDDTYAGSVQVQAYVAGRIS